MAKKKRKRHPLLNAIREDKGAVKRIAGACGISHSAVSQWYNVPPRHVVTVAKLLGLPCNEVNKHFPA